MRAPEVHQFLPTLAQRDAVGNHTLQTHRALGAAGFRSDIWAEEIHAPLGRHARPYADYARRSRGRRPKVIFYQASTGSRGLVDFLLQRPEPKTLCYHNITPASFFEAYDPAAAMVLARGREELKLLAAQVSVAVADSRFNARELHELGVETVRVVPPYLPVRLDATPDRRVATRLRETKQGTDLLFVGRVSPNKGHRYLVRMFAAFRAAVDPQARLFIVGAWGPDPYMRELFRLVEHLRLEGVVFTGSVPATHLSAYYAAADVYTSMSEHEGYGLPLIEAMRAQVPVVAYDAAAVDETMGGSGVVVRTQDPPTVAEIVGKVVHDNGLRDELLRGQRSRLEEVEQAPRDETVVQTIRDVLGT